MDKDELQRLTLDLLSQGVDSRLGHGDFYLAEQIHQRAPGQDITRSDVQQTVWSLVSQGLAYIDFSQNAPENWKLCLTEAGHAAVRDEEFNPNDPAGYLARLVNQIPGISDDVRIYAKEALHAYNAQLYLSCSVMLGVASEAAFLELGAAFGQFLSGREKDRFLLVFEKPKQTHIAESSNICAP